MEEKSKKIKVDGEKQFFFNKCVPNNEKMLFKSLCTVVGVENKTEDEVLGAGDEIEIMLKFFVLHTLNSTPAVGAATHYPAFLLLSYQTY